MSADTLKKDPSGTSKHRFETTTTLNLKETYGDDEVTLVDEIPEPEMIAIAEDKAEESITVKLPSRASPQAPRADIIQRLDQIQKGLYKKNKPAAPPLPPKKQALAVSKATRKQGAFAAPLQFWAALKKGLSLKIIVLLIVTLSLLSLILFGIHKKLTKQTAASHQKPAQTTAKTADAENLKLSSLSFYDTNGEMIDPLKIKAGAPVYIEYDLLNWNPQKNASLELTADVRVYQNSGKLILFRPGYTWFSGVVDPDIEKLRVRTELTLKKEIPPGFYKILLSLTEKSTLKTANAQAKIKIVP